MRNVSFIKKTLLAVSSLAFAAGIIFSAGTVQAIEYQGLDTPPSNVPAFNVFTGVPSVGDESDFLRARVPTVEGDSTTPYADPLNATCEAGQKIQMRVYVHNGTSVSTNENGSGPGVAHGTNVKVTIPTAQAASFTPSAVISSTNAGTVNDTTVINCNGKTVKLKYVAGSAKQRSTATGVVALSDSIVTTGTPISSHGVAGDVWACWDQRVYVVLTVEVEEVAAPVISVYSCDLITNTGKISDNKYGFKVEFTARNGAVLKDITYVYSDGTTNTDTATTTHIFANNDATKKVTATANFTVNSETKSATNDKCALQFTVAAPVTPVTPVATKPQVLPATGAGSTIALFGITSFVGAMLYRYKLLRNIG